MGGIEADDAQQLFEMQRLRFEHQELSNQLSNAKATIAAMSASSSSQPSAATLRTMLDVSNAGVANVTLQRDAALQSIQGYETRIDELDRFLKNS